MSMKQLPRFAAIRFTGWLVGLFCPVFLLVGCGNSDIRVYTVPKEKPSLAATSSEGQPQVHWQTPAGWEEREAGGMRLARFAASGKDGQEADIAVIPLRGVDAASADLVNIWRKQIGLPAASSEEISQHAEKIKIGSSEGQLFELVSTEPVIDGKSKARTYVAVLSTNESTWIFKMSGHDGFVAEQKPAFTAFLNSISIQGGSGTGASEPRFVSTNARRIPTGPGAEGSPSLGKPAWQVPSGWQEQPPSQMLLAKFLVGGDAGGKAEVTVSAFPGDTGGLLANVNRWRGQVGLTNIDQADLSNQVTSVDVMGGKAMLIDVTGQNPKNGQKARLIGAIVPREGKTWFFKMIGDEQVAEREKPIFVKFIKTVQFPDA